MREYTVYVGGPMTNRAYFNFPAFDSLADHLVRVRRWKVWNPHKHDQEMYPGIDDAPATVIGDVQAIAEQVGFSFKDAMAWDLSKVIESHGLVLLPEWETSTGATHERYVAEVLGKEIWLAMEDRLETTRFGVGETTYISEWSVALDPVQLRVTARKPDVHVEVHNHHTMKDELLDLVSKAYDVPTELVDSYTVDGYEYPSPTRVAQLGHEVRTVDPLTGGEKGTKLARFDLIPADTLRDLAEHYGRGAEKYADRNWERGYKWSLSYAALLRHLMSWWDGEDTDDEGFEHIIAAIWHSIALATFAQRGIGTDDRPSTPPAPETSNRTERGAAELRRRRSDAELRRVDL